MWWPMCCWYMVNVRIRNKNILALFTKYPESRQRAFKLTNGKFSLSMIFFTNDRYTHGNSIYIFVTWSKICMFYYFLDFCSIILNLFTSVNTLFICFIYSSPWNFNCNNLQPLGLAGRLNISHKGWVHKRKRFLKILEFSFVITLNKAKE